MKKPLPRRLKPQSKVSPTTKSSMIEKCLDELSTLSKIVFGLCIALTIFTLQIREPKNQTTAAKNTLTLLGEIANPPTKIRQTLYQRREFHAELTALLPKSQSPFLQPYYYEPDFLLPSTELRSQTMTIDELNQWFLSQAGVPSKFVEFSITAKEVYDFAINKLLEKSFKQISQIIITINKISDDGNTCIMTFTAYPGPITFSKDTPCKIMKLKTEQPEFSNIYINFLRSNAILSPDFRVDAKPKIIFPALIPFWKEIRDQPLLEARRTIEDKLDTEQHGSEGQVDVFGFKIEQIYMRKYGAAPIIIFQLLMIARILTIGWNPRIKFEDILDSPYFSLYGNLLGGLLMIFFLDFYPIFVISIVQGSDSLFSRRQIDYDIYLYFQLTLILTGFLTVILSVVTWSAAAKRKTLKTVLWVNGIKRGVIFAGSRIWRRPRPKSRMYR